VSRANNHYIELFRKAHISILGFPRDFLMNRRFTTAL
jgi:hypothetical protein